MTPARAAEIARSVLPCENLQDSDEMCHGKSCGACWYFDAVVAAIERAVAEEPTP